jgi:hypothetical protein
VTVASRFVERSAAVTDIRVTAAEQHVPVPIAARVERWRDPSEHVLALMLLARPREPQQCVPDGGLAAAIASGRAPATRDRQRWLFVVTDLRVGTAVVGRHRPRAPRWAAFGSVRGVELTRRFGRPQLSVLFADESRFLADPVDTSFETTARVLESVTRHVVVLSATTIATAS